MLCDLPVRLRFPLLGADRIPLDHAAALYGGLSRKCPDLHGMPEVLISPVHGRGRLDKHLLIDRNSCFYLQVPTSQISRVLALAGSSLKLQDVVLRIGVPRISPISPSDSLTSRIVIVRGKNTEKEMETFWIREMSDRFQAEYGADYELHIQRRRVIRVHGAKLYGFGVKLTGMSDALSLQVQANPPGGKWKYGSAWFAPSSNRAAELAR